MWTASKRRSRVNTDLSTQMLQMNSAKLQNSVQIAVFKKAHEMQTDLINTLIQVSQSAPPPGQGSKVDKTA
jgi:hypothetical protein